MEASVRECKRYQPSQSDKYLASRTSCNTQKVINCTA